MGSDNVAASDVMEVGQLRIRYLVDGSHKGEMGVFELTVPAGAHVPPPHSHTRNEECVYGLAGTLRYSVDGIVRDLAPGDCMFSPRGAVHSFSNPHQDTARALIVISPDIGAQYFRDVGAIINAGGAPDLGKLITVMSRYGLVPVPAAPAK